MKLKYGIIVCEDVSPPLRKLGYRTKARLYEDWIKIADKDAKFKTYNAYKGSLPSKADECDAYIVTGSDCSVNEKQTWLAGLFNFLRITAKAQIPVIGIGFGHQAVAHALGGRVTKATNLSLGLVSWKLIRKEGWLAVEGKKLVLYACSSDQVVKLPSRSVRVAASTSCPNAVFRVANHSIGIQGHPEYNEKVINTLIDLQTSKLSADQLEAAKKSLTGEPTHSAEIANWAVHFAYRG